MMTGNKGSRAVGGEASGGGAQTMANICCNCHLSLMISSSIFDSVCVCVCVTIP